MLKDIFFQTGIEIDALDMEILDDTIPGDFVSSDEDLEEDDDDLFETMVDVDMLGTIEPKPK